VHTSLVGVDPPPEVSVEPGIDPGQPPGQPGWYRDPYGRFAWRWWDGDRWTAGASDGEAITTEDPPPGWVQSADGRWYPPHRHPAARPPSLRGAAVSGAAIGLAVELVFGGAALFASINDPTAMPFSGVGEVREWLQLAAFGVLGPTLGALIGVGLWASARPRTRGQPPPTSPPDPRPSLHEDSLRVTGSGHRPTRVRSPSGDVWRLSVRRRRREQAARKKPRPGTGCRRGALRA
jgi:hypothetical protein